MSILDFSPSFYGLFEETFFCHFTVLYEVVVGHTVLNHWFLFKKYQIRSKDSSLFLNVQTQRCMKLIEIDFWTKTTYFTTVY